MILMDIYCLYASMNSEEDTLKLYDSKEFSNFDQ